MKVSWKTYPSNLGHRNSAGLLPLPRRQARVTRREGAHLRVQGLPHRAAARPAVRMGEAMTTTEKDWHPWQTPEKHLAVEKHKDILCYECHLAGRKPKTECNECHSH